MNVLATISIGMDPYLLRLGPFLVSWHGFFTAVAVVVAVFLVHRWGTRDGLDGDAVLNTSVWAILAGIVGARLVHVVDFWDTVYRFDPVSVLFVHQGGIAVQGAILGGFVGGAAYLMVRNSEPFLAVWSALSRSGAPRRAPLPGIGHLADIAAPALLIAMAIGRIGDIINGEHFGSFTDLPWGVVYTHPDSPSLGRPASHPAVAYELLFDLALAAAVWLLRDRLRPRGMLFALHLALYSTGRFFISFLRQEYNTYFLGFNEAQVIAVLVLIVTVPLLVHRARWVAVQPR